MVPLGPLPALHALLGRSMVPLGPLPALHVMLGTILQHRPLHALSVLLDVILDHQEPHRLLHVSIVFMEHIPATEPQYALIVHQGLHHLMVLPAVVLVL